MSDEIHFYAVRTIHEGQLDAFSEIANEAAAYFKDNDPGTLEYEWYLNEETNDCHLFERYSDSSACLHHLKVWGEKFSPRIKPLWSPKLMFVYGNPDEAVRNALVNAKPVYCPLIAGYRRF